MSDNGSPLGRIVTWAIVGVLAVVALKLAVRLIGIVIGVASMAFGLAAFLIFTLGPVVLLGWLALKAWKAFVREEPAV